MGLAERHAYRFGYLQSEHWKNLRIRKLAEWDAKCHFCNHRDLSNDVHHIHYPDDIYRTRLFILRVLCRNHHSMLHRFMEEVKASAEWPIKKEECKTKLGEDMVLFKSASIKIEEVMREAGMRLYTFEGSRLQNVGHAARILPKPNSELCRIPEKIRKILLTVNHNSRYDISDSVASKLNQAALLLEEAAASMDTELKDIMRGYEVDFSKKETAG